MRKEESLDTMVGMLVVTLKSVVFLNLIKLGLEVGLRLGVTLNYGVTYPELELGNCRLGVTLIFIISGLKTCLGYTDHEGN